MAIRRRTVQPNIWQDPDFGSLTPLAQLIFIGMLTLADDEGRQRANPLLIKSQLFPYNYEMNNEVTFDAVEEIAKKCRNVFFYEANGEVICQFLKWHVHQTLRSDRISPSLLPSPPYDIDIYRILKIVDGKDEPLKIQIAKRDKMCRYCGKKFPEGNLHWVLEHVIPTKRGGNTDMDNCVLSCAKCNTKKNNRTPGEAGMKLLPLMTQECGETPQFAAQVREVSKGSEGSEVTAENKNFNNCNGLTKLREILIEKGLYRENKLNI